MGVENPAWALRIDWFSQTAILNSKIRASKEVRFKIKFVLALVEISLVKRVDE
jgi:hypothetical protein